MGRATRREPKLRFLDFQEDWKTSVYGELFQFYSTNSFSRDLLNYEVGNIFNIHYGDIHTKFSTLFHLERELVPYINGTVDLSRMKEESFCKEGDLVIADASEDYNDIGKTIELINLKNQKILAGLHTFLARPRNGGAAKGFFGYLVKTWRVRKQVMTIAQGTKVLSLSPTRLSKIQLVYPGLPEQQKIASFLSSIDQKLVQLKRKKELLVQYKKGMMQKIFKQELRFKDEEGQYYPKWEKKFLGQVLSIGSGRDYKHLSAGDIPVYGTGGLMTTVGDYLFDGESVCIGRKGTIDKPMYFNGKFWTVDTLFYTHSFKKVFPKFIFMLFQQINWQKHNEASGVPSLSKKTLEGIKVFIPNMEEQTKIATFLSAIDSKIELISTEIEKTSHFKKGLLQQMFV